METHTLVTSEASLTHEPTPISSAMDLKALNVHRYSNKPKS